MKIKELRALRGPNYFSNSPVIFLQLDIGELEEKPTDLVLGFMENIEKTLPTLYEHTCSPGVKGGFFQRIKRGTWAGHVVEHVALELQNLLGHKVSYGKAVTRKEKGIYDIVYSYQNEEVGLKSGEMAVEIVEKLFKGETTDVEPLISELKSIYESTLFGPSTQSIVEEANRRGIPHIRLNDRSHVQLGQGKYQRRIEATLMDDTSALGVEIAADKERTKEILEENGVPVPQGKGVGSFEEALEFAKEIGYPLVLKPLSGNHGRGVTTNITSEEELKNAYELAREIDSYVVVEKFLKGKDFRIIVIDGKFQGAALREPAHVVGNGKDTIEKLIEMENENPNRGIGHEKNLTKIAIDEDTKRALKIQDLSLDSIPKNNQKVFVKSTANLSSGGTATDVTQKVHPLNQRMAERISRLIGLNVMGIDVISETLEQPLETGISGIVEVNAGPGFRMHLHPSKGKPRNIAKAVVDMLFPEEKSYTIPICAVTGTNGKTTTTRLISHILSFSGKTVGTTSTDGVFIDSVQILKGDYSGPEGAKAVMKDSTVDCGVLEVARGGIIRRGLGFEKCDVGVLLNVTSDHLGFGGIETLEELARLKSSVPEAVKPGGYGILNGDDPLAISRKDKIKGHTVIFSKDPNNKILKENLINGNFNVTTLDEKIIIQKPGGVLDIANINEIPITFEGRAGFNVENVMAAVGAAYALGVKEEYIKEGLISFSPSIGQSPGRMNIIDIGDFKVIVDYSHNVGAIHATGEFVKNLMPGKKIRLSSGVGNRRTEDIIEFGESLANYFDKVVICDASPRIRKPGETPLLVKEGILKGGLKEEDITIVKTEEEGAQIALKMAGPGDLVILQADNVNKMIQDVLDFKNKVLE